MPTEMELTLEQTQQGVSYEVSVSCAILYESTFVTSGKNGCAFYKNQLCTRYGIDGFDDEFWKRYHCSLYRLFCFEDVPINEKLLSTMNPNTYVLERFQYYQLDGKSVKRFFLSESI
ncbi:hypothetical protein Tco_1234561 [Tanacetum coccineum]